MIMCFASSIESHPVLILSRRLLRQSAVVLVQTNHEYIANIKW